MQLNKNKGILDLLKLIVPETLKRKIFQSYRQKIGHSINFTKKNYIPPESVDSPYKQTYHMDDPLQRLGEKYKPTKRLHNYLPYYWRHFRDIRNDVRQVLEIGVQSDKSIRMWEEFFPNATIYGIDIDQNCKQFEGGRRRIFIGSQADTIFLEEVTRQAGGAFDIIIDDGSHYVNHQLISFDFLFPRLKNHGIYVIEDTGSCVRDYNLRTVKSISRLLKHIYYPTFDIGVEHIGNLSEFPVGASWADKNIRSIVFYRWICFIERGNNPLDNHFLRNGQDFL